MPSLLYTIKAKGIKKTAFRVVNLIERYGVTSSKMENNIIAFIDLLERYDIKATFPITAKTLKNNADFIEHIYERGVEFAIHGNTHVDYSKMNAEDQSNEIKNAIALFNECGIKPFGFRGPYLQSNLDTLKALKENGLLYDSSHSIHWDVVPEQYLKRNDYSYNLALNLYNPKNTKLSVPYITNGIIKIPVSLPDDEMLIDRLNIKNPKILGKIWVNVLEEVIKKRGVFTLQLHPERIPFALGALEILLNEADKIGDLSFMTLKDVAKHWCVENKVPDGSKGIICITGDVDIMSIFDFK